MKKKYSPEERLAATKQLPGTTKELQTDAEIKKLRSMQRWHSSIGFIIYLGVGLAGILWPSGIIHYGVFAVGAVGMLYILLRPFLIKFC